MFLDNINYHSYLKLIYLTNLFISSLQVRSVTDRRSQLGLSASSSTKLNGEAIVKYSFFRLQLGSEVCNSKTVFFVLVQNYYQKLS